MALCCTRALHTRLLCYVTNNALAQDPPIWHKSVARGLCTRVSRVQQHCTSPCVTVRCCTRVLHKAVLHNEGAHNPVQHLSVIHDPLWHNAFAQGPVSHHAGAQDPMWHPSVAHDPVLRNAGAPGPSTGASCCTRVLHSPPTQGRCMRPCVA